MAATSGRQVGRTADARGLRAAHGATRVRRGDEEGERRRDAQVATAAARDARPRRSVALSPNSASPRPRSLGGPARPHLPQQRERELATSAARDPTGMRARVALRRGQPRPRAIQRRARRIARPGPGHNGTSPGRRGSPRALALARRAHGTQPTWPALFWGTRVTVAHDWTRRRLGNRGCADVANARRSPTAHRSDEVLERLIHVPGSRTRSSMVRLTHLRGAVAQQSEQKRRNAPRLRHVREAHLPGGEPRVLTALRRRVAAARTPPTRHAPADAPSCTR